MNAYFLISKILNLAEILISRMDPIDSNGKFIQALLRKGFNFQTVFDIGAYQGDWSRSMSKVLPSSKFVLFEANSIHEEKIKKLGYEYFIGVLASKEEKRNWWSNSGTGDSLFKEKRELYDNIPPLLKQTRTLDSIVKESNLSLPDLIKIDVQGAELEILKGATNSLKKTSAIILEIPITEYNEGAPEIGEYLAFMKNIGFFPIDILEIHHDSNILVQIDIGFVIFNSESI